MILAMPRLSGITLWLLLAGLAGAAPRVALVRISDLYRELPATREMLQQTKEKRDALEQDARLGAYRAVLAELDDLQERLSNSENPQPHDRPDLERRYALKRQEALTLYRDYQDFRTQRLKEINEEMIAATEDNLSLIRDLAARVARERGIDLVIDSSGRTNTGAPFVLYAKNPVDLTSEVADALGVTAPAPPPEP